MKMNIEQAFDAACCTFCYQTITWIEVLFMFLPRAFVIFFCLLAKLHIGRQIVAGK